MISAGCAFAASDKDLLTTDHSRLGDSKASDHHFNNTNNQSSSTKTNISSTTSKNSKMSPNFGSAEAAGSGTLYLGAVKGVWVWSTSLSSINPTTLKNAGYTDVFVFVPEDSSYVSILNKFVNKFSGTNIRVHAWVNCFSYGGKWWKPHDKSRQAAVKGIIYNVVKLCPGIAGVHLDYVRYGGTAPKYDAIYGSGFSTKTITDFVAGVNTLVKGKDAGLFLSAAVMPECEKNSYYYGQDYAKLSPYLDFLVPMVYKGNYEKGASWIGSTTYWIVQHSTTRVVTGLQSYRSDSDTTPLSASEMEYDARMALSNGSNGFVLFRYGLLNSNFLPKKLYPVVGTFTNAQTVNAAISVKNYVEKYHKLPYTVTIAGVKLNMYSFYYLLSTVVQNIYNKNNKFTYVTNYHGPQVQMESVRSGSISRSEYIHIADVTKVYMDKTGVVPGYAYKTSLGPYMGWKTLLYAHCRVLSIYDSKKVLPAPVYIKEWRIVSDPNIATFTNTQVIVSAINLKKYIATNHKLPSRVNVNGKSISIYSFYYLLTTAVQNLYNKNNKSINSKSFSAPQVFKTSIRSGKMRLSEYIHIADVTKVYMDKAGLVPGYAYKTSLGLYMGWKTLLYTYCKVLSIYNSSKILPSSILVT